MKYLLLVRHSEETFGRFSEVTRQEMLAESIQLCHQLDGKGQYLHASPLHPTTTGARVQVREGQRFTTDGPFAETHEQIAGYFLITAENLDAALDIAGRIPGARIGTVEVRQVRDIAGLPGEGS